MGRQAGAIITCTAQAHTLITLGKIKVFGSDARKPIVFAWSADVKPEDRVIRILPIRRRSSQTADDMRMPSQW